MKDEIAKSRTKIESLTSKNSKYTKQFNREFEKKMYWNGTNSYMISGVKAQYDKLKEGTSCLIQNLRIRRWNVISLKESCLNPELLNSKFTLKLFSRKIRNLQRESAKWQNFPKIFCLIIAIIPFPSGNMQNSKLTKINWKKSMRS